MRYEVFDSLGLGEPDQVASRLEGFTEADWEDLTYGLMDLGKAAIDRLLEDSSTGLPPTVLWVSGASATELIGRTMLWADHYLADDRTVGLLLDRRHDLEDLAEAIVHDLELRPLVTTGLVVPVMTQLAHAAVFDVAARETDADLANPELVEWLKQQIVIEGPTAREAIFLRIRDEDAASSERFFLYGRLDLGSFDDGTRTFSSTLLNPYDPTFDYSEWVDQSKRQTAASLLQEMNLNLAVGEAFGGHYVMRTPFRARLLDRRGHPLETPETALVWADVPVLASASAAAIAAAAQEDEAVEDLRAVVRRAFRGVSSSATSAARREVAREVAEDLESAYSAMQVAIRRERRWQVIAPTVLTTAGLALGVATASPAAVGFGAVSALLSGTANLAPYRATQVARRSRGAYALLVAARRRR